MNQRFATILGCVALLGLIFGGLLCWLGWQDYTILSLGSAMPQQISLADLEKRGPGDNIHLTVTDFVFSNDIVYEVKKGKWNRVWIPLFPAQDGPNRRQVKVVMKTFHINNEGELPAFKQKETITGVLTNAIHPLDTGERAELQKIDPNMDFATVLILEEGRDFPSPAKAFLLLGSGVFLLLAALVCMLLWIRSKFQRQPH